MVISCSSHLQSRLLWVLPAAAGVLRGALATGLVLVGGSEGVPGQSQVAYRSQALALAADIENRVVQAGGNSVGVIVASLSWSSADDLDLHMVVPGGEEISYQRRKSSGGELDVDMCIRGRTANSICTEHPVENIVFPDEAPPGRYKVYVQNFNYHHGTMTVEQQVARIQEGRVPSKEERELRTGTARPVPFQLLVKVEQNVRLFTSLCTPEGKVHADSNVRVFEFDYNPEAQAGDLVLDVKFEALPNPKCRTYEQKLLGASPGQAAPRLAGGAKGSQSVQRPEEPKKKKTKADKEKKGLSPEARAAKRRAWEAVATVTKDVLMSKRSKVLRELLQDLGGYCRRCLIKEDIVDALVLTASLIRHESEL